MAIVSNIRGIALLVQKLALGWIRFNFTAFANLPLWIAWIQDGRQQFASARTFSGIALILSLETLQLTVQHRGGYPTNNQINC